MQKEEELHVTEYINPWKCRVSLFFADLSLAVLYISTLDISQTVNPEPVKHTIFWKNSKRCFRCPFSIFCLNSDRYFAAASKKYKKYAKFLFLHFCILRSSKLSSMPFNMDTLFLDITNFSYTTLSVVNLIPTWFWVYRLTKVGTFKIEQRLIIYWW